MEYLINNPEIFFFVCFILVLLAIMGIKIESEKKKDKQIKLLRYEITALSKEINIEKNGNKELLQLNQEKDQVIYDLQNLLNSAQELPRIFEQVRVRPTKITGHLSVGIQFEKMIDYSYRQKALASLLKKHINSDEFFAEILPFIEIIDIVQISNMSPYMKEARILFGLTIVPPSEKNSWPKRM